MPAKSRYVRGQRYERRCVVCGYAFATGFARSRYCTDPCRRQATTARERITRRAERSGRNARRRARRYGGRIVPYDRAAIFERDGWMCAICGSAIDPRLRYPDPLSPSIDHDDLLVDGGDDAPWNVRASHLRCNLRRQARAA